MQKMSMRFLAGAVVLGTSAMAFATLPAGLPRLEGLDWRLPAKYAKLEGDVLTVDIPESDYPQNAVAVAKLSPEQWKGGKDFALCVTVTGENVKESTERYLGLKCQIRWDNSDLDIRRFPNAKWNPGSFTNRTFYTSANFDGIEADALEIQLGLQGTSGKAVFDLSSLRGGPAERPWTSKNADKQIAYPDSVAKDVRRRGVMLSSETPSEKDFATLKEWGANLVRFQMVRGWNKINDNQDVAEYMRWVDGRLDDLERVVIPLARKYGQKVVVDLHVPPGGRAFSGGMNMFDDKVFAGAFVDCWKRIAARFKGNGDVIYGYDLINEPDQPTPVRVDYLQLQELAAKAIRKIDPDTPIIVEANNAASPGDFSYLSPIDLDNVIYQVHMYEPHEFTHQGVKGPRISVRYPDFDRGLDRQMIVKKMAPVVEFAKKHNAKIYVGEFSAIAWAEGAGRYLADCIMFFESQGWDWTYHAFREWNGWSVEHEGPDAEHLVPSADNIRKRVLLKAFTLPAN